MAAGLGFKDFTTGEVLTANDVDGYLMQGVWVFASAAARDAAVTSPQEGNACYLKDTDQVLTYSGSAWVAVGSNNFIGCRATKTGSNQTISNNTYTLVTFNAETYDTDGFHSTSVNTERMTIPAGLAGYYQVTANVGFNTNTTGRRLLQIKKNGSAIAVGEASSATTDNYPAFNTSIIVNLTVGDYVDLEVYQTSGGSLDVLVQAERTSLQIERVGS